MLAPRFAAMLTLALLIPAGVRAAEIDTYLPADTESYISINVRQILDSDVVKKNALGQLREALKGTDEVNDILKDLGFDPFKDLDRIIIASPRGTETDRGLIIVHGTFDVKKFKARAADAAENNGDVLKIHKVPLGGGVTHDVWEVNIPNQDQSLFVALAGNRTLLVSPGKDYVVDAIKQGRLNKKPELKNKAFASLLEKLEPKQSLSIVVLGKALAGAQKMEILPKGARDALGGIQAIGGGLTFGKEVKLELAVSSKDESSAQSIRETLNKGVRLGTAGLTLLGDDRNKGITLALEVLKTVKVSSKAKVVSVTARLTADAIDDFFKKDD
jgi:hypothetical protein